MCCAYCFTLARNCGNCGAGGQEKSGESQGSVQRGGLGGGWGVGQGCTILHGVLTISSDIGRSEQYRNGTYPTWPDKISKKIN